MKRIVLTIACLSLFALATNSAKAQYRGNHGNFNRFGGYGYNNFNNFGYGGVQNFAAYQQGCPAGYHYDYVGGVVAIVADPVYIAPSYSYSYAPYYSGYGFNNFGYYNGFNRGFYGNGFGRGFGGHGGGHGHR